MENEIWKPVVGYEGLYEVSNLGRVRSLRINPAGKVMVLSYHTRGYLKVDLLRKTYVVHRLVVQAFIGDIPSSMEVNHKNGIIDDNRIENLEIVTHAENMRHASENGLRQKAKARKPIQRRARAFRGQWTLTSHIEWRQKNKRYLPYPNEARRIIKPKLGKRGALTESDVQEILQLIKNGDKKLDEIATIYGVSRSLVSLIKSGKRWA